MSKIIINELSDNRFRDKMHIFRSKKKDTKVVQSHNAHTTPFHHTELTALLILRPSNLTNTLVTSLTASNQYHFTISLEYNSLIYLLRIINFSNALRQSHARRKPNGIIRQCNSAHLVEDKTDHVRIIRRYLTAELI